MSVQLLDRVNRINRLLHNATGYEPYIDGLCELFGELVSSNVLITDYRGTVKALCKQHDIKLTECFGITDCGDVIYDDINERLMSVLSVRENVNSGMLGIDGDEYNEYDFFIIPIDIAGERLGTVLVYRIDSQYDTDDIILGEYVSTIFALQMFHGIRDSERQRTVKRRLVATAVGSLSQSEIYAAHCVLTELDKTKGILIISSVAGKYGITRSAVVNAIRKLNGAGVIESRSMGVKGTAISIRNEYIKEALAERAYGLYAGGNVNTEVTDD